VVANAVLKHFRKVEKFIHISTSEVYGTAQKEVMDEKHPLLPMNPYASAKCGADRLVYSYYQTYDLPVIIVRPFNNYGPYQHLEKAIPRFITSCLLNEPVTIHGDGTAQRDWLYVEDLCQALDKVLHRPLDKIKGEVINIGTGRSIDILTIAKIIIQKMGKSEKLITYIDDRPGQVLRHASSREKAKRLLGWEPKVKFEEGIEKTISWYQKNEEWWRKLLWMRRVPIVTKEGKRVYH
jgi:dTDP-glucose 4,6-dehydratase